MNNDNNPKKKTIAKLHEILDGGFKKDLSQEDEEYLKSLVVRLKKSSVEDRVYKQVTKTGDKEEKADLLKPKVIVHVRETKKVEITAYTEILQKEKTYDKDLFEVEKVGLEGPAFVEVKPKFVVKEKTIEITKEVAPAEELTEWEPVDKKSEKIEELEQESTEKEESIAEEFPEAKVEEGSKEDSEKIEDLPAFVQVKEPEKKKAPSEWEPIEIEKPAEKEEEPIEFKETEVVKEIKIDENLPLPAQEPIINRDEKIEAFKGINSINTETAILLYDNGITSIESLKNVTIKELRKIRGIKKRTAKKIREEIDGVIAESAEVKPIDVSDTGNGKMEEIVALENVHSAMELSTKSSEWTVVEEVKKHDYDEAEKIEAFKDIDSINKKTAILLYDNGITSIDSLKAAKIKDLIKIKGIKKQKAKEIKKEITEKSAFKKELPAQKPIAKDTEEEWSAEYFVDNEEPKKDDATRIEEDFFKEESKEETLVIKENQDEAFDKIKSIDGKIAKALKENGVYSVEDINKMTVKDLVKIKGIRRKVAKKIKKEVNTLVEKRKKSRAPDLPEQIKAGTDEWETYDEEVSEIEGPGRFIRGEYTLYEKEIKTKDGKTRTIRFFSKAEPEDAKPIDLPEGYKVEENKKTGAPYIKKKKRR